MMTRKFFSNNIFLVALAMFCACVLFSSISMAAGITAHFSWLPNEEESVTGYRIYYSTSSGDYNQEHSVAIDNPQPQDGRIYGNVSNLSEGTTYYFVVTAHDAQGTESDYSEEIQWTATATTPQKPPAPTIISVRTIN